MATLSKRDILKATQGYKTETMSIPEWGGDIIVRELTADEVGALGAVAKDLQDASGNVSLRDAVGLFPMIVAWCVIDDRSANILTVEDVKKMTSAHLPILRRIAETALRLSNLTQAPESESESEPAVPNA